MKKFMDITPKANGQIATKKGPVTLPAYSDLSHLDKAKQGSGKGILNKSNPGSK